MLLLSAVRFNSVDTVVHVLLEINPIYPDVVFTSGVLINVEIHVKNVVSYKEYFLFVKTLYCDIVGEKIILQNRPADLYNGNNFIRKEKYAFHFNIKLEMFLQNISLYFYCIFCSFHSLTDFHRGEFSES